MRGAKLIFHYVAMRVGIRQQGLANVHFVNESYVTLCVAQNLHVSGIRDWNDVICVQSFPYIAEVGISNRRRCIILCERRDITE